MKIKTTAALVAVLLSGYAAGTALAQSSPLPWGPPPGGCKPWLWNGQVWNWDGFRYVPGPAPLVTPKVVADAQPDRIACRRGGGGRRGGAGLGGGFGPGCGRRNVPLGPSGHIRYVHHRR